MFNKFKLPLAVSVFSLLLAGLSAADAAAEPRSPIVGKGSVVSKRAYLSRTWGRSNAHKARIQYIQARDSHK